MPKPLAADIQRLRELGAEEMAYSSKNNDTRSEGKGQAFNQEELAAFASLFKGRTDCWGKISTPTGECIYEIVTLKYYRRHLKGEISLGVYFNLDDSTCHFAAMDIDDFSFNKAKAVRAALKSIGIPAYIASSKSNHHHVFLFAEDRFNSREIRRILIHVRDELGIKTDKGRTLEVFPKQDYHQPDSPPSKKYPEGEKHPGSYINLPCFGATRPFLAVDNNGAPQEVPLEVALEQIKRTPNEVIQQILKALPEEPPEEETKRPKREYEEPSRESDELAVEKLLTTCAFMAYCADHAVTLSEIYWWSEGQILSFFGEPGREKYHELSSPYRTDHSAYTQKETNDKFDEAVKAGTKGIAPHRCDTIQQTHGFDCPEDCLAKKMKIKSPAGLARVLVKREKSSKYLITKTNAKGEVTSVTVDKKKLIEDLKYEFTFKSVFGLVRDDILVYEDGVYTFNGEKLIREECETRVPPPFLTTQMCHEIRDRISGTTFTDREKFNTEKYTINLENGLLDVKTRKLIPHTPAFLSTARIPITYDPQAKCPKIQKFLGDILRPEDVKVILEFFGYILIPDYSIPVVLILLGAGSNGKTQLLRLLGQFIGRGNYVSISLQDIENNSFAVANLEGKLVNIQGDLSSQWLSGVGRLKQLSGQDPISANRKYKDPLHFDNFARLVFASNKPPEIEEDTLAIWRRILPLDLPNKFEGEKDIKNYIHTIVTPQELSGLLNLALDGLQQLLTKGDFSYQGSYDDRSRQYTIASKPARAFVEERCDVGAEFKILKDELYEAYKVFCDEHRVQLSGDSQFAKELRQVPGLSISDHQYQKDGVRVRWWLRIQLKGKRENGGVRAENIPDYPQGKCPACGGEEFYLTKDGRYLCSRCHPEPKGIDVEV